MYFVVLSEIYTAAPTGVPPAADTDFRRAQPVTPETVYSPTSAGRRSKPRNLVLCLARAGFELTTSNTAVRAMSYHCTQGRIYTGWGPCAHFWWRPLVPVISCYGYVRERTTGGGESDPWPGPRERGKFPGPRPGPRARALGPGPAPRPGDRAQAVQGSDSSPPPGRASAPSSISVATDH